MNIQVPIKNLLLSKYKRELRSINRNSIISNKIHPLRHAGMICISWWESLNNILLFFSSFLPCYTIRGYKICYYHNNNFLKIIKILMKVSRVTPGHYNFPFRNINKVPFLFNVLVIFKKILWLLKYICAILKVLPFYEFEKMYFCLI